MNALLRHVRGLSPAQDRVWSQVSGLAPNRGIRRFLMPFQAFIDESESRFGDFVMAGHIARAEAWAEFAREWEELLPFGTLAEDNQFHFKMSEMALTPERLARVPAFYRIIEKHVALSISYRFELAEFKRARERAVSVLYSAFKTNVTFHNLLENPWYVGFHLLLNQFHSEKEQLEPIIRLEEKVDFIFDNRSEKNCIIGAWDAILERKENNIRKYFGATPRFEDDREFLPLQAADLWAWWVREWYEEENSPIPEKMLNFDFGQWRGKKRPCYIFYADEQTLFNCFQGIALESMADDTVPKLTAGLFI